MHVVSVHDTCRAVGSRRVLEPLLWTKGPVKPPGKLNATAHCLGVFLKERAMMFVAVATQLISRVLCVLAAFRSNRAGVTQDL